MLYHPHALVLYVQTMNTENLFIHSYFQIQTYCQLKSYRALVKYIHRAMLIIFIETNCQIWWYRAFVKIDSNTAIFKYIDTRKLEDDRTSPVLPVLHNLGPSQISVQFSGDERSWVSCWDGKSSSSEFPKLNPFFITVVVAEAFASN